VLKSTGEIVPAADLVEPESTSTGAILTPMRFGGHVPAALWESAQKVIAFRRKEGRRCASQGYPLSSGGIIRCGHCGSRMQGNSQKCRGKVYPRYMCCGGSRKNGTVCRKYAIGEAELLRVVRQEILNTYLSEKALARFRERLVKQVELRTKSEPKEIEVLRPALAKLGEDIARTVRRMTHLREAEEETFLALREVVNEMVRERTQKEERLKELEAHMQIPENDLAKRVQWSVERLTQIRGELAAATERGQLDQLLRLLVVRIELFFETVPWGATREKHVLKRGVLTLKPKLDFGLPDATSTAAATIRFAAADGSESSRLPRLASPRTRRRVTGSRP
jgi:hypothetical protein